MDGNPVIEGVISNLVQEAQKTQEKKAESESFRKMLPSLMDKI
jgi:hypothetical protein